MATLFAPGPLREAMISNLLLAIVVSLLVVVVRFVAREPARRELARRLLRRRSGAVAVLTIFAGIAMIDSVEWIGGSGDGDDKVSAHESRSFFDRTLGEMSEKSYSAPLSRYALDGRTPLRHPGKHLLGTNVLGQDVLYLTCKGAKVALLVGTLTSLIAIPLALLMGMLAGYFGGKTDHGIFFLMNTLASLPTILLLVALIMALGKSTLSVCVALGVTSWVSFARLSRGETMRLRELDYVAAAKSLGVTDTRILLRHILPNLMHLVVISFVLMFSGLVLSETTLAWLGIGVDGSWGQMIAQAKDELSRDPLVYWNVASGASALFFLILSVNLLGDALSEMLNPRRRRGES
jgi:peptide/nickel transport system permease protein